MKKNIVEEIIKTTPLLSNMVTQMHITHILNNLQSCIENNIEGDVVELGCNVGTTSIFIQKLLLKLKSNKMFSVYDSFEGLPKKHIYDETNCERQYRQGSCKTSLEIFRDSFKSQGLQEPIIHIGWFKEIADSNYPEKISFAFFDGDFYSSIIDSFEKIYSKLTPGACVIVHDYGWDVLPGVKQACVDFLQDKPENMEHIGESIGLLVKV